MRNKRIFLSTILIVITFHVNSQEKAPYKEHSISKGWNFEFGGFLIIPTSSILFKKWKQDNTSILIETISNEWEESFFLGDYWALSKNVGNKKPIIVGVYASIYELFYEFNLRFTTPVINDIAHTPIEWEYLNSANFNNYNAFIDYPFWYKNKLSTFSRVSLGISHYLQRVNTRWKKVDWKDHKMERVDVLRNNSFAFNFNLGIGLRWQILDFLAITSNINYQFQTPVCFSRFSEIAATDVILEPTSSIPNEEDFILVDHNATQKQVKMQYENLNMHIGIAFDLGRIFNN